jgi:hypothetical protein
MAILVESHLQLASGVRIQGLSSAQALDEPLTLGQYQAAANGMSWKDNVRVKAPGNVNLAAPGASMDGIALANGDRLLLGSQTNGTEIGIYVWSGSSTALVRSSDANTFDALESAIVVVDEGTSAGTRWRQTAVNGVIGTNALNFVPDGAAVPNASETTAGVAEIATQAETDAGTDDIRFVTPAKLKASPYSNRTAGLTIGDGSTATFSITHSFNTYDIRVLVYEASGNRREVVVENDKPDANTIRVLFATAPTANSRRVVVQRLL